MKQCSLCNQIKTFNDFNKKLKSKDGYMSECRECNKKRRKNNKNKIKKYNLEYKEKNRTKIKNYKKQWKLKNLNISVYNIKYLKLNGLHDKIVCFAKLRTHILNRDCHKCQLCNSTKTLQVHHIIPQSHDITKIFDPYNLISLCYICHLKAHLGNFKLIDTNLVKILTYIANKNELAY